LRKIIIAASVIVIIMITLLIWMVNLHEEEKVCFQYTSTCTVCEGDTYMHDYNIDKKYSDPFYKPNIAKFTVDAIDGYYYKYNWNQKYPDKLITFWVLWFDAFYMSDSFNNSSGFEFCTKWKKEN